MPVTPTYPGVYIEEIPSGVRTITGVATSITAFIGRAKRGSTDKDTNTANRALTINSFADFERIYGGLWEKSTLGYAVRDFFVNGGSQAIVVRLYHSLIAKEEDERKALAATQAVAQKAADAAKVANAKPQDVASAARAEADKQTDDSAKKAADSVAKAAEAEAAKSSATAASVSGAAAAAVSQAAPVSRTFFTVAGLSLVAAYPGSWGQYLRASVDFDVSADAAASLGLTTDDLFNLTVTDVGPNGSKEKYYNLTLNKATLNSAQLIDKALEAGSKLVRWDGIAAPDPSQQVSTLANARKALAKAQQDLADATKKNDNTAIAKAQQELTDALRGLEDDVTNDGEILGDKKQALAIAKKKLAAAMSGGNANDIKAAQDAVTSAQDAVTSAQSTLDAALAALVASDGGLLEEDDFTGPGTAEAKQGLYALKLVDLFNILCIPPYKLTGNEYDVDVTLVSDAAAYCELRRAMLLVDPPSAWIDKDTAKSQFLDASDDRVGTRSKNAALFFPRLKQPNPLHNNQIEDFVPSSAVAGIFARTDTQRGVWKAPAGLDATLVGVPQLSVFLNDAENGELNPLGINCLRAFPAAGRVVWGSRTLQGNDNLASEWKYIPVRRTALYIEESLFRGTQWVVFEPNDEPLWAQIRLNVGAFMQNLFRQGAFQGQSPRDAYFVKCDKETTTPNDINLGIVNIVVGFAPLKPAEFVIIKIQQIAGQIAV